MTPSAPQRVRRGRAVTLLELLVTIAIVAIVSAILLPALGSAKDAEQRAACLSTLRGIGVAASLYSSDHQGTLPTLFSSEPPETLVIDDWGGGNHPVLPIDQIFHWSYLLRTYASDGNLTAQVEALSCPSVLPDDPRYRLTPEDAVPASYSYQSYSYSPACFTRPSVWKRGSTPDVNASHQPIRASSARHPSRKSLLVEYASRHDGRVQRLPGAATGVFLALAIDGHAEPRRAEDSTPPVRFSGFSADSWRFFPWTEHPTPLLAPENGIHGRDW